MSEKPKRYRSTKEVCERYGGRHPSWLWRLRKKDPRFPRPLNINDGPDLYDEDELDRYDQLLREQPAVA